MAVVAAHQLTKDYGSFRAVDHIDFEIRPGECFGFLGPNGAGKTTAMKIIYCFMPPTSGRLTVFGLDVTKQPAAIKARLGVMPQENNLDPDLTVMENLIVYARYFDIPKRRARERAEALLGFVEITAKSQEKIANLSGGLKRRLVLARSLINDPQLLILDEPTTGLDPHSRRATWENLRNLMAQNTTILLTTHYMEEAESLCDRVAIMDEGRIKAVGSPSALGEEYGGNLEEVYLKLTGRRLES
ncbi:MAG: hypothetical protein OHK006_07490 [Thermodesulfovibrionales bacterium]